MNDIVMFTKTCERDFERVVNLAKSIEKHNVDSIPWYVSTHKFTVNKLKSLLEGFDVTVISDEEIYSNPAEGWVEQQLVKCNFYKLKLSKYVFWIDSDSYFIKDFKKSDFLSEGINPPHDTIPYMVEHPGLEFWEWTSRYKDILGFDPKQSFISDIQNIRDILSIHDTGIYPDYGPSPCVWRNDVWKCAEEDFGIDNLLRDQPSEIKWYGELVKYYNFDYISRGPYFKVFHYEAHYEYYKQLGYTEKDFEENYFGIIMQSNWNAKNKY